jgi:hypothetical protein
MIHPKNAAPAHPPVLGQRAAVEPGESTPPRPLAPVATFSPMKPYYAAPPGVEVRHPSRLTVALAVWCVLYGAGCLVWLVVR